MSHLLHIIKRHSWTTCTFWLFAQYTYVHLTVYDIFKIFLFIWCIVSFATLKINRKSESQYTPYLFSLIRDHIKMIINMRSPSERIAMATITAIKEYGNIRVCASSEVNIHFVQISIISSIWINSGLLVSKLKITN